MTSDSIDRQAVLKAINNMVKECDSVYVTSALRNLEVIVADLPSAQPETHEERTETHSCDCISRQAAIDALEKVAELYPWRVPGDRDSYSSYNEAWQDALNRADSEIEALPPAQPERKKGTWTNGASCPFCGYQPWYERDIHTLSFCPSCGADLRGGK